MEKYSEKLKKQIVAEYLRGVKTTAEILSPHNIPKSNLYHWVKQYGPHGSVCNTAGSIPSKYYKRIQRAGRTAISCVSL